MCNLFVLDPIWLSAIAAVVYAFFTGWMIWEIRKDRKLAYKPIVKAIYCNGTLPNTLLFNFKNVGKGPALNLKIDYKDNGEIKWRSMKPLAIGSGEGINITFDVKGKDIKFGSEIFLDVEYMDIFNKTYRERVSVPPKSEFT